MRPVREEYRESDAAYFVSTQTAGRKPFFRHERWARLMIATIEHYAEKDYVLHAFVVMSDHLHLLISPSEAVEKSVQLIKGGFSFRAKRELAWKGEIWQPGFTDHRIRDEEDWKRHLEYIRTNPIEAPLVEDSAFYEFVGFPNSAFPQGLKPTQIQSEDVRAKARTLQPAEARVLRENVGTVGSIASHPRSGPDKASLQEEMNGTGFSPGRVRTSGCTDGEPGRPGALAPEEGNR